MGINKAYLTGNISRDPVLRTGGDTPVLQFGIAVDEPRRNRETGEWESVPSFFDCVAFGARAEGLSKVLEKGMKATVEGRIRKSAYVKDDERRYRFDIVAEEVELMSRPAQQREPEAARTPSASAARGPEDYEAIVM